MLKALLCKLNIQHDWHIEHADDGALYKRCKRCGKDDDRGGGGTGAPGAWAGPAGMGQGVTKSRDAFSSPGRIVLPPAGPGQKSGRGAPASAPREIPVKEPDTI